MKIQLFDKQPSNLNSYLLSYKLSNEGFNLYADSTVSEDGDFSHSGLFALIDKDGNIRSRYDEFGNPIIYYRALDEENSPNQIKELKDDIKKLLNQ